MKRHALLPLITLALTACGGSDGGNSNTDTDLLPSTLSSVEGKIEYVSGDTVTVNGQQFRIGTVSYQGTSLSADALAPEMLVSMQSSKARSLSTDEFNIALDPTFTGEITTISGNSFTIDGHITLQYDNLDPRIQEGDWVMVSALPTANAGYKVLSVIKFENEFGELAEAEGRIADVDFDNQTFKLGQSLTVYFDTRLVNNVKKLRNGAWVEVLGSYDESNGWLIAEDVKVKGFDGVLGRGETEGIVTWVSNDAQRFEVNYRGIFDIHPSTKFDCDDGQICNAFSLQEGMEVEVEYVNQSKRTIAKEIEFEGLDDDDNWDAFEFEKTGYVSDIDQIAQSFVIDGKTIFTDSDTEFENGLTVDTLIGQYVDVEGVIVNDDFIAREIELQDNDD